MIHLAIGKGTQWQRHGSKYSDGGRVVNCGVTALSDTELHTNARRGADVELHIGGAGEVIAVTGRESRRIAPSDEHTPILGLFYV